MIAGSQKNLRAARPTRVRPWAAHRGQTEGPSSAAVSQCTGIVRSQPRRTKNCHLSAQMGAVGGSVELRRTGSFGSVAPAPSDAMTRAQP